MFKLISAAAAIAFGAALVLALPGFSPEVEARTPAPVVKSDRLDIRPAAPDCSQQAWPYYQANCLTNGRSVRVVSTDRITR